MMPSVLFFSVTGVDICGTRLQRYVRTVLCCYIAVTSLGSSTVYFPLH